MATTMAASPMVMETAVHDDVGTDFCKLFARRESKKLNKLSELLVDGLLRTCVRCIPMTPQLKDTLVVEVGQMRRRVVALKFSQDFGRERRGDPLDYLSDLTTWLSNVSSSECILISQLLCPEINLYCSALEIHNDVTKKDELNDFRSLKEAALDVIFKGFFEPLRLLVEQVWKSRPNLVSSYTLCSETAYISSLTTISRTALGVSLGKLHDATVKKFNENVISHGKSLSQTRILLSPDHSLPKELLDEVSLFLEIVKAHDDSILFVEILPYEFLVTHLLNPILEMARKAAIQEHHSEGLSISIDDAGRSGNRSSSRLMARKAASQEHHSEALRISTEDGGRSGKRSSGRLINEMDKFVEKLILAISDQLSSQPGKYSNKIREHLDAIVVDMSQDTSKGTSLGGKRRKSEQ